MTLTFRLEFRFSFVMQGHSAKEWLLFRIIIIMAIVVTAIYLEIFAFHVNSLTQIHFLTAWLLYPVSVSGDLLTRVVNLRFLRNLRRLLTSITA